MRTVELLDQLIALAERMGYQLRYEPLAGSGGGVCEFAGSKWLFVDLGLSVLERLDLLTEALAADPSLPVTDLNIDLKRQLGLPVNTAA